MTFFYWLEVYLGLQDFGPYIDFRQLLLFLDIPLACLHKVGVFKVGDMLSI